MRKITTLFLLAVVLLSGCGSSQSAGTSAPAATTSATAASGAAMTSTAAGSATASSSATAAAGACPSSNTRSFAKTRFVADLGGAAFLIRRYIYQPYTAGKFRKGASGRTLALVKATAATATSLKLLKNADTNAKANPTLCKTIAAPLGALISTVGGLKSVITGGGSSAVLGGLGGALTGLLGKASSAGVPVQETPTSVG
jgi:uncharacterized protein YceK